MAEITVYCDGSSIGNPGPGGWGAVVKDKARVKEIGGYEAHTTNNRMELTAAIEALKILKTRSNVTMHTDSRYVINGITKWVHGWEKKGWQTLGKTDVVNKDLWQELMLLASKHEVAWQHVKGHSGIDLNERVDQIANGSARKEKMELYHGSLAAYRKFLDVLPKARSSSSSKNKGKTAFSYVSLVAGKVKVHKTWKECEERVKGKSAKYQKVLSAEEEADLVRKWSL